MKQSFPMHAILTARFQVIFTDDWGEDVFSILSFIAGYSIMSHEMPFVLEHSPRIIEKQHPELNRMGVPLEGQQKQYYLDYCQATIERFGETLKLDNSLFDIKAAIQHQSDMWYEDMVNQGRIIHIEKG